MQLPVGMTAERTAWEDEQLFRAENVVYHGKKYRAVDFDLDDGTASFFETEEEFSTGKVTLSYGLGFVLCQRIL